MTCRLASKIVSQGAAGPAANPEAIASVSRPLPRSASGSSRGGKPEEPGALKVFDYADGVLSNEVSVAPNGGYGFGPRHLDFHPIPVLNRLTIYGTTHHSNVKLPSFIELRYLVDELQLAVALFGHKSLKFRSAEAMMRGGCS